MFGVDWRGMLVPDTPLLEIAIRGSLVYLGTFVLLRVILKRETGGLGISDIIVIVFIADAAQNAMSGSYKSVPDGLLLVAVLMFWAYTLDRMAFRYRWFERLVKPKPISVVRDGRMLPDNMRREYITASELLASLRLQGIEDIAEVKTACVESDGTISVVKISGERTSGPKKHRESR